MVGMLWFVRIVATSFLLLILSSPTQVAALGVNPQFPATLTAYQPFTFTWFRTDPTLLNRFIEFELFRGGQDQDSSIKQFEIPPDDSGKRQALYTLTVVDTGPLVLLGIGREEQEFAPIFTASFDVEPGNPPNTQTPTGPTLSPSSTGSPSVTSSPGSSSSQTETITGNNEPSTTSSGGPSIIVGNNTRTQTSIHSTGSDATSKPSATPSVSDTTLSSGPTATSSMPSDLSSKQKATIIGVSVGCGTLSILIVVLLILRRLQLPHPHHTLSPFQRTDKPNDIPVPMRKWKIGAPDVESQLTGITYDHHPRDRDMDRDTPQDYGMGSRGENMQRRLDVVLQKVDRLEAELANNQPPPEYVS